MNIFADTIAADPQRAHSAGYGPPVPVFPPAPSPVAGVQASSEDGDPVTPEEVDAEFGPAQAADVQAADQADAAPDVEPLP